jgi:hypothetical protein
MVTLIVKTSPAPLLFQEGSMETHVIYCSACDREVTVLIGSPGPDAADDDSLMGVTCTEIGKSCTGQLCPICAAPPDDVEHREVEAQVARAP